MSRKIFCSYFQIHMNGLEYSVYPGIIGEKIYNNISKKAWYLWLNKQTKLINEHNLNMAKEKHLHYLEKEMILFLFKNKI
ncbi:oxidative damage protection protein [Enterobacteriaceae endosymbiont of Neohaemonia nigricornis]|uniref:oxidative damage protection protein n=1 Tax=Enterobacteriaceae endosymbiont of Neohaemonia nigricornis TaxID=2675792 RepID=UPI001449014A|nr:oxidative damage protection protein [Enterobacteriaceae endosymbiont of Neohaemonia nigricornis]QJC30476.1 oxidative damage protection protein [Enterobacteriaceae endosymbiont of Neohaemonia nigricornis]